MVNSVQGDPRYGENSALYASFGYIRNDDRKTALTRAANNVVPAPTEMKAAEYEAGRKHPRPDQ